MTRDEFLAAVEAAAGDRSKALALTLERMSADTGTIHLLGEDGLLHLEAWAGHIPQAMLGVIETIPVGKGIAGLTVERAEPVDLCNLQTDQSGQARPGAKATGVRGSICVPLMVAGKAIGALGVATVEERKFTAEEIALLMRVGEMLGQAASLR
jgi:GAF domain-containing protein